VECETDIRVFNLELQDFQFTLNKGDHHDLLEDSYCELLYTIEDFSVYTIKQFKQNTLSLKTINSTNTALKFLYIDHFKCRISNMSLLFWQETSSPNIQHILNRLYTRSHTLMLMQSLVLGQWG